MAARRGDKVKLTQTLVVTSLPTVASFNFDSRHRVVLRRPAGRPTVNRARRHKNSVKLSVGGGGSSSAEELREEPRRERNVDGPDRGVGTVGRRCRRRRRAASVVVHRRAVSARVASRWTVRSKACAHGIGGSRCHSGGLRDTLNRCTFACLVLSSTSHHVRPPLTGRHSYYVCNRRSQIDLWRLQRWIYAAASSTSSL
uniref:Uncharacterized protein n=1 Tax=Plectus sambesii TaxID=2011161 RepID=A0A914V1I5_9BILA